MATHKNDQHPVKVFTQAELDELKQAWQNRPR